MPAATGLGAAGGPGLDSWDQARRLPDPGASARPNTRLFSRNGHNFADRVPLITEAIEALPVRSCVVDGEAIVCDDGGLAILAAIGTVLRLWSKDRPPTDGQRIQPAYNRRGLAWAISLEWDAPCPTSCTLMRLGQNRRRTANAPLSAFEWANFASSFRKLQRCCDHKISGFSYEPIGLLKDDTARSELITANMKVLEKIRTDIRALERELDRREDEEKRRFWKFW
jgi:hypothetical protein